MKFYTHKISTSNGGSFGDLIQKVAGSQRQVKTASSEEDEDGLTGDQHKLPEHLKEKIKKSKGAESDESKSDSSEEKEAKAKGRKTVKAESGVDDDGEGKRTDVHHGEGSPSDQNGDPEEDGENKTVDPAGLGESSKEASSDEEEIKVASESDLGDGSGDGEDSEGKNSNRFPEPDRESSDCYNQEAEDDEKEASSCTTASSSANLKKIANLKPKEKARLKEYFRKYYPESYADALTQDK